MDDETSNLLDHTASDWCRTDVQWVVGIWVAGNGNGSRAEDRSSIDLRGGARELRELLVAVEALSGCSAGCRLVVAVQQVASEKEEEI